MKIAIRTSPRRTLRVFVTLLLMGLGATALAYPPYVIPTPSQVAGKEYSNWGDKDQNAASDPDQVLLWDGTGAVSNGFDYSGSRAAYPGAPDEGEVDGLASPGDAYFFEVIGDVAALIFSTGDLGYGGIVGDANLYAEPTALVGGSSLTSVWATAADIDASGIRDLDAAELWGPNTTSDANQYSLYGDPFVQLSAGGAKVSIWEYDGLGSSVPAILTRDVGRAIALLLGDPALENQYAELLDVDAFMSGTLSASGILFSVAPITVQGSSGPVTLDGGEIFTWDGSPNSAAQYLNHGGHLWDTAFNVVGTFGQTGLGLPIFSENIDALEAINLDIIPEPSSAVLALLGLACCVWASRQRLRGSRASR